MGTDYYYEISNISSYFYDKYVSIATLDFAMEIVVISKKKEREIRI